MIVQIYVVVAPKLVEEGLVVQLSGVPVPEILQFTPPFALVGTVAEVPVTVAVNVRVEPKDPPPELTRTTVGITFEITTEVTGVAARAM